MSTVATPRVARVAAVLTVALLLGGCSGASSSTDRLPDLDQEAPTELGIRTAVAGGRSIYVLGFRSAVRNIGAGPLIVNGARPDASARSMAVDQTVNRTGAPPRQVHGVGRLRYVISPDHRHWHYLRFERYELRRAATGEPVVADHKSGFCLGDRYNAKPTPRAAPSQPVYTGHCGLAQPERLDMREGISVGYGDDYNAFLEGQDLPLSGLRGGRYILVHRVNANRHLQERSYSNDAASLLLDLRWSRGSPQVRVLATCPETDRCAPHASG